MARPESIALAGYFPTPCDLLPSLASLVRFEPQDRLHVLVDPCAGDGAAIAALRDRWFPRPNRDVAIYAVELEEQRAQSLRTHLGSNVVLRSDAFHLEITPQDGASLLYLNPPYDVDKVYGRLEQRFLERWTAALLPGHGVLMFLVPFYSLQASAGFLARNFQDLRAWRFPDPFFEAYRQCVLVARRRGAPLRENPLDQKRIERWAADATLLPELGELSSSPLRVQAERAGLALERMPLDIPGLLTGFRPWHRAGFAGLDRSVGTLIGAKFPVAQPPRPAHIALALSVGTLNGKTLTPNDPELPPILVKGSFRRDFQVVEDRFDSDGEKVGSIQVQRPRLTLSVLRLDSLEFLELKPGAVPSGARDLAEFNSADLVLSYGESLGRLTRQQFPALHDPANPAHQIELPPLNRRPLRVQRDAIITGLKLLASGENPQAIAEVGTGKSTVALSLVGALSPGFFRHTVRELTRLGFDTSRLSPVQRTLIICPPHLLQSWRDQAAAVLPFHRVILVEGIADLHRDAEIYVLSREVAKLGHGIKGMGAGRKGGAGRATCPRCGALLEISPERLAETRARCASVIHQPVNEAAWIAEDLAVTLIGAYPYDPLVRSLVSGRRILAMTLPPISDAGDDEQEAEAAASGPLPSANRLRPIALRVCELIEEGSSFDYRLPAMLDQLCHAVGLGADIAEFLRARARHLLDSAAAALDQDGSEYREAVFRPRQRGGQLLELAAKLERPSSEESEQLALLGALEQLHSLGRWEESEPCGEPLFQATPAPRRYPLARYILRYCRRKFGMLIADEWHEYSNRGSAQQKAAHRLVALPGVPTIALTGSLMGGYAASLFSNLWALSQRFRHQFQPWEQQADITAYGYRKIYVPEGAESLTSEVVAYGSRSDREQTREAPEIRQMGQAPGVLPSCILEHLLPVALIMHKEDLDEELPPCSELPVAITVAEDDGMGQELLTEFRRLLTVLTDRIRKDRYTHLAGALWGAMSELPSYLDRCTGDLPEFVLRYPKEMGGAILAAGRMLPSAWITPKERWILRRVRACIQEGRNVLIFLRHTGDSGLPARYLRLFREHLGQRAVFLDVHKVKAAQRERWLNENVIEPGRRILIANPKAIQTGLNNLVAFSRAIWVEGVDYDARVVRQANGRLHRIGQERDVTIEVPYYDRTVQKTALDLVARKVSASLQVDGLSIEGALESAGAGGGADEAQAAMGIGQAIYEAWAH
ncbi:MAG TPA: DUF6094 domain-containing protein [Thermoanaerobaculia bacterium]|jgi:hypothetical protein|nr:DUF6094 domain-containing protein [Thermoanaerobaculia bacterium]